MPTLANPVTLTKQIAASSDDVNEEGTDFRWTDKTVWVGTGGSAAASYTGLRFTSISIPKGATIVSAHLEVYSSKGQWIAVSFQIAAEATDAFGGSLTFTSASRPSQRLLTSAKINHSSNVKWNGATWYSLDEMASVIQEAVNRPSWQSGNSLAIVLKGTGSAFGRKFVRSFDQSASLAPKLVVTYR